MPPPYYVTSVPAVQVSPERNALYWSPTNYEGQILRGSGVIAPEQYTPFLPSEYATATPKRQAAQYFATVIPTSYNLRNRLVDELSGLTAGSDFMAQRIGEASRRYQAQQELIAQQMAQRGIRQGPYLQEALANAAADYGQQVLAISQQAQALRDQQLAQRRAALADILTKDLRVIEDLARRKGATTDVANIRALESERREQALAYFITDLVKKAATAMAGAAVGGSTVGGGGVSGAGYTGISDGAGFTGVSAAPVSSGGWFTQLLSSTQNPYSPYSTYQQTESRFAPSYLTY